MLAVDYLENTANKYGNKICIKEPGNEMTYRELLQKSKNLGYHLSKELSGARDLPIAVLIDKGCDCLTAIFGVLYSGNCYVPLDIKTPKDRLASIFATMDSNIVITVDKTAAVLDDTGLNCKCIRFESLVENEKNKDEQDSMLCAVRNAILDTDLMYILFTSGSTGAPKGVAITHRSVDDYIQAFTSTVPITADDIVGNQVPFYVDMSLKDIYMSIAVGATIVVIPQTYFMSPKKLLTWLDTNGVTMIMWVPTAYSIISRFDGLSRIKPSKLKLFLFSGEGMPISVYRYWAKNYPEAKWIQQYGPTEITGACTSFSLDRIYEEGEAIPIGKPFPNTGIMLLTENGDSVPSECPDVLGEICVYGSCLAAGYYNNPEKTEEAFIQNPLIKAYPSKMYRTGDLGKWDGDGNLIFVSRKDYQIKHGGRRIELGEIETAVDAIHAVRSACCVHDAVSDTIVLFYVGDISETEIREQLKSKIPPYMIPGKYMAMEALPQLTNGKLDRKTMQKLASTG